MSLIRRRLFWKIYLTLLTSLVAAALVMGSLWWFLGKAEREWWEASRIPLRDTGDPKHDLATQFTDKNRRVGGESGADVSVYTPDGTLIASQGKLITLLINGPDAHWGPGHILRVDLPDGRIVLARMQRPPGEQGLIILAAVLTVIGGIGLAAFPVTARLTRKLEALRFGVARWGEGKLSARVDETGSDEVALVARTFNTAASQLEALLASQRALLANASHELRSPLARLRLAVELWLNNPAAPMHAEIVQNLSEVDQLVDEILLSSRLDHPSLSIGHSERIDVLGLAAEETARFGATISGDCVDVLGDTVLLRRLLRNLLENALKHGKPPIDVTVARQENEACIVVADHGPGIAPQERERVFEPFYRPHGRDESSGGWGLGLALVRQIAARHGGRVECGEEAGGGSRFIVHLAAAKQMD